MYQMKQNQTRHSLNITSEAKPGKFILPTKMTACLQNISWTSTIHPGILLGRTLWTDSVSPRATAIASCERFKPRQGQGQEKQMTLFSRESLTVDFICTLGFQYITLSLIAGQLSKLPVNITYTQNSSPTEFFYLTIRL